MAPSSAAMALRESFGDRKLPEISRKITACVACRKLKIKCRMNNSKPPCTRCKTRGLSCTINKSLQMLLENDASWKEAMEQRIYRLEEALVHGSGQDPGFPSATVGFVRPQPAVLPAASKFSTPESVCSHETSETTGRANLNLSCSLGAFPASSMIDLKLTDEGTHSADKSDLISRGLISLATAESYFAFYQQNLDPCVHHILAENDSLANVRSTCPLLTAAICTVAAFCTSSKDYQPCFKAYTNEVSRKLFSDDYTFDDVRALCIGAFWLNKVSSALNGLAVRIATELDLHRCITKMPHTKRACYERTRLFFLVYLCDHHCSLIHGRPPMTRELRSLKSPGVFLRSSLSTRADLKLISQVELWSISNRVFNHFGADIESSIVRDRSAELERLSSAYDTWYQDWLDVLTIQDEPPETFSRRVFDLYFHSAKLYLFSHVFRGPSQGGMRLTAGSSKFENFAQRALQSALSIVRCVVDEKQAHPWLENLPFYFGTMIAFASVCLIKTLLQEQTVCAVDKHEILGYLHQLVEVLRTSSVTDYPIHPLLGIAKSLEVATGGRRQASHDQFDGITDENLNNVSFNLDLFANDAFNFSFPMDHDDWMLFPEEIGLRFPDAAHS